MQSFERLDDGQRKWWIETIMVPYGAKCASLAIATIALLQCASDRFLIKRHAIGSVSSRESCSRTFRPCFARAAE